VVGTVCNFRDERRQLGGTERGGVLTGGVDVVGQRDPRRVARDELHLARGQGRPERADDVLEALLVCHEGVRVALDENRAALFLDGRLGTVDEVQGPALVEERRGRGVEVLGSGVAPVGRRAEDAAAEAGGVAGRVADGKDDAGAETVVDAAPVGSAGGQTGSLQVLFVEVAALSQGTAQRVP